MNFTDIDLKNNRAFIKGKGFDDREMIYLHFQTVELLNKYIRTGNINDGALFKSFSNNSRDRRITTKTIRDIVGKELKQLEIKSSVHGFRHYFTTKLLKSYNGDVLAVSKFTRHKNVETLQIYNDSIICEKNLNKYYNTFNDYEF